MKINFEIKVVFEKNINWELQNEIHKLLNKCYSQLTNQFLNKTYAYMAPEKRILVFEGGLLVGHCGMASSKIKFEESYIEAGNIGLMASIAKKPICELFLRKAISIHQADNMDVAIGYCSNPTVMKHVLPNFKCYILDIPTIGQNSKTKPNDKTGLCALFRGLSIYRTIQASNIFIRNVTLC